MNNNNFNRFHKYFVGLVVLLGAFLSILTLKFSPFTQSNSVDYLFLVVLVICWLFIFVSSIYHRHIAGVIYTIYLIFYKRAKIKILILDDEKNWTQRHRTNLTNLLGEEKFEFIEFQRYKKAQDFAESHPDVIFCIIDEDLGGARSTGKDTINEINRNRTFINKLQVYSITKTVYDTNQQRTLTKFWNPFKRPLNINENKRNELQFQELEHGSRIYRVYGKNLFKDPDMAKELYSEIASKIKRGWLLGLFDNQQP